MNYYFSLRENLSFFQNYEALSRFMSKLCSPAVPSVIYFQDLSSYPPEIVISGCEIEVLIRFFCLNWKIFVFIREEISFQVGYISLRASVLVEEIHPQWGKREKWKSRSGKWMLAKRTFTSCHLKNETGWGSSAPISWEIFHLCQHRHSPNFLIPLFTWSERDIRSYFRVWKVYKQNTKLVISCN